MALQILIVYNHTIYDPHFREHKMCSETTYYLKYNSLRKHLCPHQAFLQAPICPGIALQPGAGNSTRALLTLQGCQPVLTVLAQDCARVSVRKWLPVQKSVKLHKLRT